MSPRNVLILKLGALGDIAISTTLCRRHFEGSPHRFTWLTDNAYIPVARELLPCEWKFQGMNSKRLFRGSTTEKILESLQLLKQIRLAKPDLILILHRDSRYRSLARIAAPLAKIEILPRVRGVSEYEALQNYLDTHFSTHPPTPVAGMPSSMDRERPSPKTVALQLGGGENPKGYFREKTWPHWAELAEQILTQSPAKLILMGSDSDYEAAKGWIEDLASRPPWVARLHPVFGKKGGGIPGLLKLFESIDALVSVDTGIAHLAAQTMKGEHKNIVTLFGPTSEKEWRPRSVIAPHPRIITIFEPLACHPCYQQDGNLNPCIYTGENFQLCMKNLPATKVFTHLFLR